MRIFSELLCVRYRSIPLETEISEKLVIETSLFCWAFNDIADTEKTSSVNADLSIDDVFIIGFRLRVYELDAARAETLHDL